MLLEHKLHATRLQSEVSLLTQEKVAAEESVEALLEEISEFEQGVAQLEKEMHQLSKIEAEAVGVLDEEAKYEFCLLYTSPSPRDQRGSRMPSSA